MWENVGAPLVGALLVGALLVGALLVGVLPVGALPMSKGVGTRPTPTHSSILANVGAPLVGVFATTQG